MEDILSLSFAVHVFLGVVILLSSCLVCFYVEIRRVKKYTTHCHQCHLPGNGLNPRRVGVALRITEVSDLEDLGNGDCMDED